MKFIHENTTIIIQDNNIKAILPLEEFIKLEPKYEHLPNEYTKRLYIPNKIHIITGNNKQNITKDIEWEHGNRYIRRINEFKILQDIINKEEEIDNKLIESEIEKTLPYGIRRKNEYPKIEELVIAIS